MLLYLEEDLVQYCCKICWQYCHQYCWISRNKADNIASNFTKSVIWLTIWLAILPAILPSILVMCNIVSNIAPLWPVVFFYCIRPASWRQLQVSDTTTLYNTTEAIVPGFDKLRDHSGGVAHPFCFGRKYAPTRFTCVWPVEFFCCIQGPLNSQYPSLYSLVRLLPLLAS